MADEILERRGCCAAAHLRGCRAGPALVAVLVAGIFAAPVAAASSGVMAGGLLELLAKPPDSAAPAAVIANGGTVRSGELVQIRVRADRAGYLYVLWYGSTGRVTLLRPPDGDAAGARVGAGQSVVLPAPHRFFPLDARTGEERVYAFVSSDPIPDLEALRSRIESAGSAQHAQALLRSAYPDTAELEFRHAPRGGALAKSRAGTDATGRSAPRGTAGGVTGEGWAGAPSQPGVLSAEGSRLRAFETGAPVPKLQQQVASTAEAPKVPAASPPAAAAGGTAHPAGAAPGTARKAKGILGWFTGLFGSSAKAAPTSPTVATTAGSGPSGIGVQAAANTPPASPSPAPVAQRAPTSRAVSSQGSVPQANVASGASSGENAPAGAEKTATLQPSAAPVQPPVAPAGTPAPAGVTREVPSTASAAASSGSSNATAGLVVSAAPVATRAAVSPGVPKGPNGSTAGVAAVGAAAKAPSAASAVASSGSSNATAGPVVSAAPVATRAAVSPGVPKGPNGSTAGVAAVGAAAKAPNAASAVASSGSSHSTAGPVGSAVPAATQAAVSVGAPKGAGGESASVGTGAGTAGATGTTESVAAEGSSRGPAPNLPQPTRTASGGAAAPSASGGAPAPAGVAATSGAVPGGGALAETSPGVAQEKLGGIPSEQALGPSAGGSGNGLASLPAAGFSSVSADIVRVVSPSGAGAGVLVDRHGAVLTAARLVEDYPRVTVYRDGKAEVARVVRVSPFADLALLHVDGAGAGTGALRFAGPGGSRFRRGELLYVARERGQGGWTLDRVRLDDVKDDGYWFAGGEALYRADLLRARTPGRIENVAGAPVFDGDFHLLGMASYWARSEHRLYAVLDSSIRRFLTASGLTVGDRQP